MHRQLAEYAETVEHLSLTDTLTELSNRRHFDTIMRYELESSSRDDTPVALLLIDLDRFKLVNDAYGHMYGDVLLKAVAVSLTRQARAADLVARWGGEEFVVLAPGCDSSDAMELTQRLRRAIQETRPDDGPGVTATIGVAEHRSGESGEDFLRRVDKALYDGKAAGRNRVVLAA